MDIHDAFGETLAYYSKETFLRKIINYTTIFMNIYAPNLNYMSMFERFGKS